MAKKKKFTHRQLILLTGLLLGISVVGAVILSNPEISRRLATTVSYWPQGGACYVYDWKTTGGEPPRCVENLTRDECAALAVEASAGAETYNWQPYTSCIPSTPRPGNICEDKHVLITNWVDGYETDVRISGNEGASLNELRVLCVKEIQEKIAKVTCPARCVPKPMTSVFITESGFDEDYKDPPGEDFAYAKCSVVVRCVPGSPAAAPTSVGQQTPAVITTQPTATMTKAPSPSPILRP